MRLFYKLLPIAALALGAASCSQKSQKGVISPPPDVSSPPSDAHGSPTGLFSRVLKNGTGTRSRVRRRCTRNDSQLHWLSENSAGSRDDQPFGVRSQRHVDDGFRRSDADDQFVPLDPPFAGFQQRSKHAVAGVRQRVEYDRPHIAGFTGRGLRGLIQWRRLRVRCGHR